MAEKGEDYEEGEVSMEPSCVTEFLDRGRKFETYIILFGSYHPKIEWCPELEVVGIK